MEADDADIGIGQRVRALYATLARKVAWPMNLYVQYYNPEGFDYRAEQRMVHAVKLDPLIPQQQSDVFADLHHRSEIGASHAAPQPIYKKVPHVPYTMADYLAEVAELFRGHEVLRDYAAALGARIVRQSRFPSSTQSPSNSVWSTP